MKKLLLLFFSFILLQTSCSDSFELEQTVEFKQENDLENNFSVGMNEAVIIASQALDRLNNSFVDSRNSSKSRTVKQVLTYPTSQSRVAETSLYIVNFEEGGFAIVSADERTTDVYALSNEGEFKLDNVNSAYFMNMITTCFNEEIDSISSQGTDVSIAAEQPAPEGPEIYAKIEYEGRECYWYSETTQTTPFNLLVTNWSQGEPYRHFCFTESGENAVAGCVPIAMAQIMAYHKRPNSFNNHTYYWDYLTQSSTISTTSYWADNVAYLVHDIGVDANVDYGTEETGANNSNAVLTFRNFGYSATLKEYVLNDIISALDDSEPVYISGVRIETTTNGDTEPKGHAWVLDGYYEETTEDRYYDVETLEIVYNSINRKYYLHCNWGWGNSNCYCLSKVFTVGTRCYDRDFSLIYVK